MSDSDKTNTRTRQRLTLGVSSGTTRVKQSFSHGRTNSVVVETKRRRKPVVKPGLKPRPPIAPAKDVASSEPDVQTEAKASSAEMERRKMALAAANTAETARRLREAEEARKREAERERRRQEIAEKEREVRERQKKLREREESEKRAAAEARKPPQPTPVPTPEKPREDTRPAGGHKPVRRSEKADDDRRRPGRGRGQDRPRRSGKLTITQALSGESDRERSLASIRRAQERERRRTRRSEPKEREKIVRDVQIPDTITVQELANRMAERSAALVKVLMKNGIMANQNASIDADIAQLVVEEFGHNSTRVSDSDVEDAINTVEDAPETLKPRPPVVTIMGHVDHGKTSILDAIRKTQVAAGEDGGITQHIGAYQVRSDSGARITFLDTPGHEAFTSMRARGAEVTDIVVLVVAADDSVMPQTVEAINHARAANVPIIVAINKIDRPGAQPAKVRSELLRHNVAVEAMSGDVLDVEVSAITGQGLDRLIEAINLQAEILELGANPKRSAEATVVEAQLKVGRGHVATVLVKKGTLKQGDVFVVGEQWGKVRAIFNDRGKKVRQALPSEPVEVLGLNGTPEAGDTLHVLPSDSEAKEIAAYRQQLSKDKKVAAGTGANIDQLFAQAGLQKQIDELAVVIKADVQGSLEAIVQSVEKIGNEEVRVRVLHSGVGAITETDITLAEASNALVIGFNVRANAPAKQRALLKKVEIRYYSVIYNLIDEVRDAASGLLSAEIKVRFIGYASVRQVFRISGVGRVAGCYVSEGQARRSAGVRLLRDDIVIHEGRLKTLKRFQEEVREVYAGQECGMAFENYDDIREGDVIEVFESETIDRTLE